jgi:predicted permease
MIRPEVREYFRLRPRRSRVGAEVEEEITFHIEQRVAHLVARGLSEEEARAEAERLFGPLGRARMTLEYTASQRERSMSIREWFVELKQDLQYSARSLARDPWVSVVIVLTLSLGIGANATMFGIVDQLLLRGPAHVVAPEMVRRLYVTQNEWDGVGTSSAFGYAAYTQLRDHATSLIGVAAYRQEKDRIGSGRDSHEEPVGYATPDFFPLLGVKPALGRFYSKDEDVPHKTKRVVVLDYDYWQHEYNGARDVLGRTIEIDGHQYSIVGVAPKRFTGPDLKPLSMWVPLTNGYEPHPLWETTFYARWLSIVARLKPDVTPEAANAQLTALYRDGALHEIAQEPKVEATKATVSLRPLHFSSNGEESPQVSVARWLTGVSVVVLLIACANITNLLLARAVRRRREISVRLAMGISRMRLARLLFSETLLLAAGGVVGAVAVACWGGLLVRKALMPDIAWGSTVDVRLLLFAIGLALLTALVTGVASVFFSRTQNLVASLRGTTQQGGGSHHGAVRDSLMLLQASLSLVLLIGAGLFVRSLYRATHVNLGIDAAHLISVNPQLEPTNDSTVEQRAASAARTRLLFDKAAARLRAGGDAAGVALAMGSPFTGSLRVPLSVPGRDSLPRLADGGPYITVVSPVYFETVGTRIVRGRGILPTDVAGSERVVVVSQTMAARIWPGEDALNKCVLIMERPGGPCTRVVGIAENAHRNGIKPEELMQYYVPMGQEKGVGGTMLIVRARGDAAAYEAALQRHLFEILPEARYFSTTLMQNRLDPELRPWRLGATMFLVFGALALLIAGVGLFSVIAYSVAQRRNEIGIRMALGAQRSGIVSLVLMHVMKLAAAGALVGILIALLAGRYLQPLLFDTSPRDVLTFVVVPSALMVTALMAGILPAARAGGVDPTIALRAD